MHDDSADTLGIGGFWSDPLWRVEVVLTPLERRLLTVWPVRRLAYIAHAGAASITTTQGYSRLEHSLGLLALVTHFDPDDHVARIAALLHDVGHLPFSHTLEGLKGLDHHSRGRAIIRALGDVLSDGGIDAEQIVAVDEGTAASPLASRPGCLKLDHLDSFLRSGQAHGRTSTQPAALLGRLRLLGGTVDTDPVTATELIDLVIAEARAQRSPANIVPVAVLRELVGRILDSGTLTPDRLGDLTDDELWAVLLADSSTATDAGLLRRHPERWRLAPEQTARDALRHVIRRSYLDLPTVNGETTTSAVALSLQGELPLHLAIERIAVPT
jgi:HD superfamily phosphohydrolase